MNLIDEINAEIKEQKEGLKIPSIIGEKGSTTPVTLEVIHEPALKRGRGRPPVVEDARFIELWNKGANEGGDLREVAKDLGIAPASASVRASLLRKKGKVLNQFRRGRRKKVQL